LLGEHMTTSIYLVRHGQTAWNREEIFRGRSDIPLDETGLKQAAAAGQALKEIELEAIYSSPLRRAYQTAEGIASFHNLPVQPLAAITDMSFGRWEGRSVQDIRGSEQALFRQWREEPHLLQIPGGETLDQVGVRAMAALQELVQSHADKTFLLVSHRVVNRVLLCGVLGIDNSHFWQIDQDAVAINVIHYGNGRYSVSCMNERCHVKGLGR
jgi:phosphoserine phosphatase